MAYLSDNDDEFAVYDRDAIVLNLRNLVKRHTPLNASFNGGSDVLLTVVLDIDVKARAVYLDVNANNDFNNQLLSAKRVMFQAMIDGMKLMWHGENVQLADFEGQKAFRIALPERLQRIQRRGAFRVKTPITNPVLCRIKLSPTQDLTLSVFDICVEGVGVILPAPLNPAIQKMVLFKGCTLMHEDLGEVEVTILVKSIWEATRANGSKVQHAGLEFVSLPMARQTVIQRFVHKLERQLIATMKPV